MAIRNKTITLAVLANKLDTLAEVVKRVDYTLNGEGDEPGLKGRLKLLEDHEANEKWYFRSLWAAIISTAIAQYIIRHVLG